MKIRSWAKTCTTNEQIGQNIFVHFDSSKCLYSYRISILLFLADAFSALLLSIKLSVLFPNCVYHLAPLSKNMALVDKTWVLRVSYQFYHA